MRMSNGMKSVRFFGGGGGGDVSVMMWWKSLGHSHCRGTVL
jgi:hypothetical protein